MSLKQTCNFIGDSSFDGQPVELSEDWSSVYTWRCTDYKTGCTVWDSLKFAYQGLRKARQGKIAIVEAGKY